LNLGINIQLKRSCKDLSPLKMFFGTIPTFLKGIIHNCGYWLITVFKICMGNTYSSYSFGATALIFCTMFIHIMEVCMSTGF
jgi:hypothetical protein